MEGELLFWEAGQQLPNPANIQPSGGKCSPEPTACRQQGRAPGEGWQVEAPREWQSALCSLVLCRLEIFGMIWDHIDLSQLGFIPVF